jgi:hypothetical protein
VSADSENHVHCHFSTEVNAGLKHIKYLYRFVGRWIIFLTTAHARDTIGSSYGISITILGGAGKAITVQRAFFQRDSIG